MIYEAEKTTIIEKIAIVTEHVQYETELGYIMQENMCIHSELKDDRISDEQFEWIMCARIDGDMLEDECEDYGISFKILQNGEVH